MFILLTSCATHRNSIIKGYDYNKEKDETVYFVIPYGNITLHGHWIITNYNSSSRQQFFRNSDSVIIAISFGPCDKYEFNTDTLKTGFEFVKSFYEWDSQYFSETNGLSAELIEQDSSKNFIIWKLYGFLNDKKIDNYFLFGVRNCFVSNFLVLDTKKWKDSEKINFLRNLYIKNY